MMKIRKVLRSQLTVCQNGTRMMPPHKLEPFTHSPTSFCVEDELQTTKGATKIKGATLCPDAISMTYLEEIYIYIYYIVFTLSLFLNSQKSFKFKVISMERQMTG